MSEPPVPRAPIAVTGATGEVGGRIARLLAAREVPQRLIVRNLARAPKLSAQIAEVHGGYEDTDGIAAALTGVETLLLVPGHEASDRVPAHRSLIDAAVRAGVRQIVQLSFIAAAPDATFTFARDHWATEQDVRASGLDFTIARMNYYLDVLPQFVLPSGDIAGPGGDGRVAAVARDDVAAAAAELLVHAPQHAGATYELTGPQALSFSEAAVTMARVSGRTISYLKETVEEAWAARAHYDAPESVKAGWISTYTAVAAGDYAQVTGDVERLIGRPPIALSDWLAAHPLALAHVDTLG